MRSVTKKGLLRVVCPALIIFLIFSALQVSQGGLEASAASKVSAKKAYAAYLAKHPAKEFGDKFYTADFQPKSKTYVNEFCLVDIDKDKQLELITRTNVNFRWFIIRVYEYKNGKVQKYKFKSGGNAVFNNRATAAGSYQFFICKKGHLHNTWFGGIYGSEENIYNLSKGKLRKYLSHTVEMTGAEKAAKYGKKITVKKFQQLTGNCKEKTLNWQKNTKTNL